MRSPTQTAAQAEDLYQHLLVEKIAIAAMLGAFRPSAQCDDRRSRSLRQLGFGMHALMDFFSPYHRGFQVWDLAGQFGAAASHVLGEPRIRDNDPSVRAAQEAVVDYYRAYENTLRFARLPFADPTTFRLIAAREVRILILSTSDIFYPDLSVYASAGAFP